MSRIDRVVPEFVELVPQILLPGTLYVSKKYSTASHLCCCGCGNRVVTPLKPGGWRLIEEPGGVTLDPSIGSWNLACKSHYLIRAGRVVWAPAWSPEQIKHGWERDQRERKAYFNRPEESLFQRVIAAFKRLFRL